jgi:EmrB/QacA subfamily drug resistance transporter
VVAVACAGQFMVVLDVSVVNVALPAMRSGLGFAASGLQWVVIAYSLALAGFLLLGGRMADLFGRRRVFVLGLVLFSLASLVGGAAPTPGTLIAARAVQGLGAAVLAPASLTILTTSLTDAHVRARALATWSAVSAAGGAAGNLVGGVLTEFLSWRWTLLINLPIGIVVAVAALRCLAESHGADGARRLDVPGALLATLGPAAITYAIGQAPQHGWTAAGTLVPLAVGVLALAAFLLVQARWAAAPLMPLRVFRSRALSAGNALFLLLGAAFMAMWYFLSLYMQNVLGYTALQTGVGFVPHTLAIIAGSRLAPRLMARIGTRALIMVASVLGAAGFGWQSLVTPDSSYVMGMLLPGIAMCGALGLLMAPVVATVTNAVDTADAGLASGLLNAVRQVGGAIGLAVLTTLAGRHAVSVVALGAGYVRTFLACAVLMLAVAGCALLLPRRR